MFRNLILCFVLLLGACAGPGWHAPGEFTYVPINSGKYTIATWQKITDNTTPIRIYLEGDGRAFNAYGHPTSDPTPTGTMLRDMATRDSAPNVVYIARPCQFIKSNACSVADWTSGRFSSDITESVAHTIQTISNNRPVVLIGYSGGALLSGLVIKNNPQIQVAQWITIAGVLDHKQWTEYFNDAPLSRSLNLNGLPHVNQCHFIAARDRTVPMELSQRWIGNKPMTIVPNATHSDFGNLIPKCD